jgi:hypothetical protein
MTQSLVSIGNGLDNFFSNSLGNSVVGPELEISFLAPFFFLQDVAAD